MAGGTILVVNDHLLNRALAGDLLEGAGYTVHQTDDGQGLIERVTAGRRDLSSNSCKGSSGCRKNHEGFAERPARSAPGMPEPPNDRASKSERVTRSD